MSNTTATPCEAVRLLDAAAAIDLLDTAAAAALLDTAASAGNKDITTAEPGKKDQITFEAEFCGDSLLDASSGQVTELSEVEGRPIEIVGDRGDDDRHLYVKTFLISDERNRKDWRASWKSIKENARSFVGRPGIEYYNPVSKERDHTDFGSFDVNIAWQEPYRVTTIVDTVLDEETHTAYAIHRVDDENFAKKLRNGEVKYLSPSIQPVRENTKIVRGAGGRVAIDTTKWKGVHDAWVDRPAYGHMARVVSRCEGGDACVKRLKDGQK